MRQDHHRRPGNRRRGASKHVMIVGAGNIGSHLGPMIARIPSVAVITIVDYDSYEGGNLTGQSIGVGDVGQPKAVVMKRRLTEIDPRLDVRAVVRRFEDVSIGHDPPDVILAALDGRAPRLTVNQVAWRFAGIPVIDAGVNPEGALARMTTIVPADDAPCLECAWSADDYEAIAQTHSCDGEVLPSAPTGSPAALGGLAASLQALECERLLNGASVEAREVVLAAGSDRHFVTVLKRNPSCRFDHERLDLVALGRAPSELCFEDALGLARGDEPTRIRVEGKQFVQTLRCAECRASRPILRLRNALGDSDRRCERCGAAMSFGSFDCAEWLDPQSVGKFRRRSLRSAGLAPGDVITVAANGARHHFILAPTDGSGDPRQGART